MKQSIVWVLALGLGSMACTRHFPPPADPAQQAVELETMPEGPIPAGAGRVFLDAEPNKGAVRVVRVGVTQMMVSSGRGYAQGLAYTTQLVCSKTPCAIDLPAGSHELVFQAVRDDRDVSTATFDVTAGRSQVVRHAVGYADAHLGWKALGVSGMSLGLSGALLGGLFIPLSSAANSDGLRTVGVVSLAAGAGLMVVGITGLILGRTEIQPGATTQWTLPREGGGARPGSVSGQEHALRSREERPKVQVTGDGFGIVW